MTVEGAGNRGLSWLGGRHWWQVTREERFFCAELYAAVARDPAPLVGHLNEQFPAAIDTGANWQIEYEVCLYRDWLHAGYGKPRDRDGKLSLKRTFDLALFSDSAIVLIEAKAQQGLEKAQLKELRDDRETMRCLTGVAEVHTAAIVSSRYRPKDSTLAKLSLSEPIRWKTLAGLYPDSARIFERADCIYGR